ncbi:MAG: putative nuclease of putative toxin-antitoxin system [Candidatus Nanohaloarchaea archaeon]|jgi:predicted nuclease of predicted toxin-antitoxin system
MIILLDENVDNRIKKFLENKTGFRVLTTFEEGLNSSPDREILRKSLENNYLILTHDDDFLSITSELEKHASIIYLPQRIKFREMKTRIEKLAENELEEKNEIYFV